MLNIIDGDLQPLVGEVRMSHKLRIGRYYELLIDLLTTEETLVQYLLRLHLEQECAKLGKFGLPNHNHLTPITGL